MLTSLTHTLKAALFAPDMIEKTATDIQDYVKKRILEKEPSLEGKTFKIVDEETKEAISVELFANRLKERSLL